MALELDDLDLKLIDALRRDGRTPTLELARQLEIPESTARKRVRRLLKEGIVRVVAVVSTRALGYVREVTFVVKTDRGRALSVAERVSAHPNVRFVAFGMGAFDLSINAVFRNEQELFTFATQVLADEGIVSYESVNVLAVFKRSFDWLADRELLDGELASVDMATFE